MNKNIFHKNVLFNKAQNRYFVDLGLKNELGDLTNVIAKVELIQFKIDDSDNNIRLLNSIAKETIEKEVKKDE